MRLTSVGDKARARRQAPLHPNQAAIFERLEATKRYGLVADYRVSFSSGAGGFDARVTVWRKEATPSDLVRHYIARLLAGLVTDRGIVVAD